MTDAPKEKPAAVEGTGEAEVKSWREAVRPAWEYYKENAAGGSLHIVLDDGNLEDYSVDFCIKYAEEHADPAGVELARRIRTMSVTQRAKLYKNYNLYANGAPDPEGRKVGVTVLERWGIK